MSHQIPATPLSKIARRFSPHHSLVAGFVKSGKAQTPGHTALWYFSPEEVLQYRSLSLSPLDVDRVALIDLYARVHDRDDVEALSL